jgi:rsbT co-antagonist protein RsbR
MADHETAKHEKEELVTIPASRLRRLMQALSYATVDALEEATALLSISEEDEFGELEGVIAIFLKELRLAKEVREAQEQNLLLIERQQLAIRELSTPIIDIWDGILTLPIVGVVDSKRSAEMMDKLLERIVERSASCVIIDVTGVDFVDTMTAANLIKMVNAARLLGTYCVFTGIRPDVAQTLAQSEIDIGELKTLRSLREGLQECFRYIRAADAKAARAATTPRGRSTSAI